ncbi:MAG: hypothetical protein LBT00_12225, partial [Spirochaetaceae bacterium]|nr:hypothetical protein [Spirochaetaceae bacterium]
MRTCGNIVAVGEAIQTRWRVNASRCLLDCFPPLAMTPAVGEAGRNDGGSEDGRHCEGAARSNPDEVAGKRFALPSGLL